MAIKKSGLGKGLDALLSDTNAAVLSGAKASENSVIYIDINKITPNRKQPRKLFEDEALSELAESIRLHGVIQPIIVRSVKNGYEIVAGERRWRASRLAELKEVPCIIKAYNDTDNLLIALIENLQRENLNPMEEAEAYSYLSEELGMNQTEISANVGKSRSYVANAIRLQNLPEELRAMVRDGKLSAGHGRALLSVEKPEKQMELALRICETGMSVRETEAAVKELADPKAGIKTPHIPSRRFKDVEAQIKDSIGAKVKINEKNNRGNIQLSFYSREELERLIELLSSFK